MTLLAAATNTDFAWILLSIGLLVLFGARIADLATRSFLSLTVLFVSAGMILGPKVLDVVHVSPDQEWISSIATIALVVILFRDGLEIDRHLVKDDWHLPVRKLIFSMPLTAIITALIAWWLLPLGFLEALLIGVLLSPTDPVLSSGVLLNPKVPKRLRHSLQLESGLNDGLALPFIVILLIERKAVSL